MSFWTAICIIGGKLGLYAMFGTFFFMSVMFPTIFALGIRGLATTLSSVQSLIVMSIVGGAIAAPFMGHIADTSSMRIGFVVPLVCFIGVALYAASWQKLNKATRWRDFFCKGEPRLAPTSIHTINN